MSKLLKRVIIDGFELIEYNEIESRQGSQINPGTL